MQGSSENQTAIALRVSQQTADTLPQPTRPDQSAAPEQPHTEHPEASSSTSPSGVAQSKDECKKQQLQGEQLSM